MLWGEGVCGVSRKKLCQRSALETPLAIMRPAMTILRTFSIMTLVIALMALVGCGGQQADSEDAMMEGDEMEMEGHDMDDMDADEMEMEMEGDDMEMGDEEGMEEEPMEEMEEEAMEEEAEE
jgi:hypothetical protein